MAAVRGFNPIPLICGDNPLGDCILNLAGAGRCESVIWLIASTGTMIPDPVLVRRCSAERVGKCIKVRFLLAGGESVEYVFEDRGKDGLAYVHPGFEHMVCVG